MIAPAATAKSMIEIQRAPKLGREPISTPAQPADWRLV
jgi:hypothetical protein